jgi:V-type H+-transporting ATPase subunit a
MFGDIGHGACFLLVGIVLCLFCDILRRKAPGMEAALSLRYVILMMGFFGFYCGLIYNDFMAIPLWLFDSCYDIREGHPPMSGNQTADGSIPPPPIHAEEAHHPHFSVHYKDDCVYPIGIDPAWYMGANELTFLNSLKMKLAVILGVLHMCLGIVMKAFNA